MRQSKTLDCFIFTHTNRRTFQHQHVHSLPT